MGSLDKYRIPGVPPSRKIVKVGEKLPGGLRRGCWRVELLCGHSALYMANSNRPPFVGQWMECNACLRKGKEPDVQ